jgi:hypothetical protein
VVLFSLADSALTVYAITGQLFMREVLTRFNKLAKTNSSSPKIILSFIRFPHQNMTSLYKSIAVAAGASLLSALAASAAVYSNDFNVADGTTNFGGGVTSQVNAGNTGGGFAQGGQLRLTTNNIGSTNASLTIPGLAGSSLGWTATFSYTMSHSNGLDPADGWSFNYGDMALGSISAGGPEEGFGPGTGTTYVAAMVDTWQNSAPADPPDVGIATNIGAINTVLADQNGIVISNNTSLSGTVSITYDPVNGLSFLTTGLNNNANFTNVALPGFVGNDAYNFALAARTGGATQDFLIDNLVITTVPEVSSSLLAGLAGLGFLSIRRRK